MPSDAKAFRKELARVEASRDELARYAASLYDEAEMAKLLLSIACDLLAALTDRSREQVLLTLNEARVRAGVLT